MTIHVRRAAPFDTGEMARLLNAIIERGGTTALTRPITGAQLAEWIAADGGRGAWHIAEDDAGTLLGFQWIGPHENLPPEACDVATFVRIGQTGQGIGARLFEATRTAARALGYAWINATIRADNSGGLAYYGSRGFENWAFDEAVRLDDGTVVDKISKRYNL